VVLLDFADAQCVRLVSNKVGNAHEKTSCFAEGKEGDWEGICVDLDIAVQGQSFDEVEQLLKISIQQYVDAALEEEVQTRVKLLNRRAPLHVRAGYALRFLLAMLRAGDGKLTHGYTAPAREFSTGHCSP
jgi:predicted RNase H-like HicB family nuclease